MECLYRLLTLTVHIRKDILGHRVLLQLNLTPSVVFLKFLVKYKTPCKLFDEIMNNKLGRPISRFTFQVFGEHKFLSG